MDKTENGPIVGIDLGTTNSVVAGVVDGKVIVLSEDDQQIYPSVVGLDATGKMITGNVARNQLAAFPDRTIASVKRKMGSDEKINLGDQTFTPQEISAMILRRLRDRASRVLGQPVERAVITVPAFFDENQRQATREAGLLAGLKVERIINEPTAATLVYHADSQEQRHIVVYDFGGGTFDVSVVRFEMGVVEVLSSKGDTQLGGDDLDELLLDHIANDFYTQHKIDLRDDLTTRYRLLQACEAAKKTLSESATAKIAEEFIAEKDGKPLNLTSTITRNDFEKLIQPLVDQTLNNVDAALRDSGLSLDNIDDLVLVGGSTRIPLVSRRLSEELKLEASRAVNPDLAVALGAATQAAMFDGLSIGPVLVDITGHTLGLEVISGFNGFSPQLAFSPIIRRNSPLPATYEEVYSRTHEEQDKAEIHVLQGESSVLSRNQSIGRFMLDLETGSDISDEIAVRFDLTLDGILKVTATQSATGKSQELIIDNALSEFQGQNREQAEARLGSIFDSSDEILDDADLPKQDWQSNLPDSNSPVPNIGKYPAAAAILEQCQSISGISAEDVEDIRLATKNLRAAIANDNAVKVASLCEELDDILFYIQG
jgi:molecular chaperone DnaK